MLFRGTIVALVVVNACGSDVVLEPARPPSPATSTGTGGATTSAGAGGTTVGSGGAGTGGQGGAPPNESWAACFWAGGLDRLVVKRLDVDAGVCLRLQATWPAEPGPYPDVEGNDGWAVTDLSLTTDLTGCLEPSLGEPSETSASASGSLYVPPAPPYPPPTLDLAIEVTFASPPPGISATHSLQVDGLSLSSCP